MRSGHDPGHALGPGTAGLSTSSHHCRKPVGAVREPFDRTGLDSQTPAVEPRVAVLAAGHPPAARERVLLADLGLGAGDVHRFLDEIASVVRDLAQRCSPLWRWATWSACCPPRSPPVTCARVSSTAPSRTHPPRCW
ncbi:hypothetical protein [Streptomyces sp. NPDC093261]|uniref:hypothetical protein n=1 Tax=Streptomyces sp. NPDC093261 TaxID=3366037 RepID=UPI00381E67A8